MTEATEQGIRPFLAQNCRLTVCVARSRSAAPAGLTERARRRSERGFWGLIVAFSIRRIISKLRLVDRIRTPVARLDAYGINLLDQEDERDGRGTVSWARPSHRRRSCPALRSSGERVVELELRRIAEGYRTNSDDLESLRRMCLALFIVVAVIRALTAAA